MVIRSYTADSVASALKRVRTDMGGKAIVLKTRVVASGEAGKTYEVTACLDKPTVHQVNQTLAPNPAPAIPAAAEPVRTPRVDLADMADQALVDQSVTNLPVADERLASIEAKLDLLLQVGQLDRMGLRAELKPVAQAIRAMQSADLPEHCISAIFDELKSDTSLARIDAAAIRESLVTRLEDNLETDLEFRPGDRVLVAGPAGSGKTSLIGRLAARLTFEQKITVKLVSLDNIKIGSLDEIASYADLLGLADITTPDNLRPTEESIDSDKVVLIDTCALPSDPEHLTELMEQVRRLQPTHRLGVFSALTRSSDVENIAARMVWLEPTHLAFTMTDLTDHLGALMAGAIATNAKIAMITDSPSGADSFRRPNASDLAAAILGEEVGCE